MAPHGPRCSYWILWIFALLTLTLFTITEVGCGGSSKSSGGGGGNGGGGGGTGGGGGNNASSQQFVYVANGGTNTTGFVLNTDGSLTAISGSPFAVGGTNIGALPKGPFVFSVGGTMPSNNAVNTNSIGSDGTLSISSSLTDSTDAGPVEINPDGSTLYVGSISASQDNPGFKVYSIQSNGSLQFTTSVINQNAGRFTFLSDGTFAYAAYCYHLAADIQGFNTANGGLTAVFNSVPVPGPMGICPNTVALTPDGTMLAAAWSDADNVGPIENLITLYSVTSSHGLSLIGTSFAASGAGVDSVVELSGKFFIVAQDNGVGVYQVSSNTVSEVSGSPFANGTSFTRLTLSASGNFVVAISAKSSQVFVFSLNSSTGALTEASGSPQSVTTPADIAVVQQ